VTVTLLCEFSSFVQVQIVLVAALIVIVDNVLTHYTWSRWSTQFSSARVGCVAAWTVEGACEELGCSRVSQSSVVPTFFTAGHNLIISSLAWPAGDVTPRNRPTDRPPAQHWSGRLGGRYGAQRGRC